MVARSFNLYLSESSGIARIYFGPKPALRQNLKFCRKIWPWKSNYWDPTASRMSQTCPNRSETSYLMIRNTFSTSISHIRVSFKKVAEGASPEGGRPRCVCFLCFVAVSLVHSPVYIYFNDSFLLLFCSVYSVQFLVPTI